MPLPPLMTDPPMPELSQCIVESPIPVARLQAGDLLLYGGSGSLVNRLIQTKTWSWFSHVEVYEGPTIEGVSYSLASRNGLGVDRYPTRFDGMRLVVRPSMPLDLAAGRLWFETYARGQEYDWLGLLSFAYAGLRGRENAKMFCSEFAARWLRVCIASAAGLTYSREEANIRLRHQLVARRLDPWNGVDADALAPEQMATSALLPAVYASKVEYIP